MRTTSIASSMILALVLAVPGVSDAKPRCTGPFKKTCLKSLFACFRPAGACTSESELSPDLLTTSVTTCWTNGATTVSAFDLPTRTGTLTVTSGSGRVCTTAQLVTTSTGVEWTYVRRKKRWIVSTADDGSLTVTCPSGRVETYPAQDLTQADPACTGPAAPRCQVGSCP